jgi:hypothetical protein
LCVGEGDCNDNDPSVSSQQVEICNNAKDDDCDQGSTKRSASCPLTTPATTPSSSPPRGAIR